MGKFKDQHGKSRVGLFLKDKAPQILETVGDVTGIPGLNLLSNLITGDKQLSPEDKNKALELLSIDLQFEQEITKRHEADMNSDNWLSKSIRPIVLIYMMLLITFMIVMDYFKLPINKEYMSMVENLTMSVFLFYFGARGIEKVATNFKRK